MTPTQLLHHYDHGQLWPAALSQRAGFDVPAAYQQALAVRQLRLARGEQPRGFKIGFTNRSIWARYAVFAPIWGCVWHSTLTLCEGEGQVSLALTCQPRLARLAAHAAPARPAPITKQRLALPDQVLAIF